MGWSMGSVSPSSFGRSLGRKIFFSFWGIEMRILVHSRPGQSEYLLLPVQADCGSIKGAGVPTEEGTEHYLP